MTGEFTAKFYYSPNFPEQGLMSDGKPVITVEDVLHHNVTRASKTVAVKPAFVAGDIRFRDYLKTLPVRREKFDSFFKDGRLRVDVFEEVWSCLKPTHSPGAPLNYLFTENDQATVIKADIYNVVDFRMTKLIELGEQIVRDGIRPVSLEERISIVSQNYADPMMVDVKKEPRLKGKMPRLVTQGSIVDQLVHRLVYHEFLITLQESKEHDMAVRLDLITQDVTQARFREFQSHAPLTQNDVQGWEYSMNQSDHWAAAYCDAYQMGLIDADLVPRNDALRHYYAIMAITYTIINRVTLTKQGNLLLLPDGIMPSGILPTFQRNSRVRALLSYNVAMDVKGEPPRYVLTAGDDCADSNNFEDQEQGKKAHAVYGKVVTDISTSTETFTFCSTIFTEQGSYQENIEKSAYKIVADGSYDIENITQFVACYKLHPDFPQVLATVINYAGRAVEQFPETLPPPLVTA